MANTKKTRKKVPVTYQKKKVRSRRGVPETNYGEIKKVVSFSLTPTALNLLKDLSQELNISTSELLERFARLEINLKDFLEQEVVLDAPMNKA